MSWRTATPKFVARLWNRKDFFRCEWPHFPRSSIEWPAFSAGPWEVVTSRASLGWTQSWCWTYRQTAGYLVLDILIPGGGKDFLNPVGISEKNHAKTQRERDQPTQRVLQFIIDWILHVQWCFNLVLSLKWKKLEILTTKSGYQSNVETLHELHADVFEMTCLTLNTWQKTVWDNWNTP